MKSGSFYSSDPWLKPYTFLLWPAHNKKWMGFQGMGSQCYKYLPDRHLQQLGGEKGILPDKVKQSW
jgi:hypothetical protein